jgi:hypothetical protein
MSFGLPLLVTQRGVLNIETCTLRSREGAGRVVRSAGSSDAGDSWLVRFGGSSVTAIKLAGAVENIPMCGVCRSWLCGALRSVVFWPGSHSS